MHIQSFSNNVKIGKMKKIQIHILIPVFEDFNCLPVLLKRIDQNLKDYCNYEILIIDDGSLRNLDQKSKLIHSRQINILTLSQNVGHQRSIAIGICHLSEYKRCDFVLIMDGDGEDNPLDVKKLINKSIELGKSHVVFARRDVRSEPLSFKFGYLIYRILFRLSTGKNIKFGNFSLIPFSMVTRLTGMPELWNHYASGILASKLPIYEVSTKRTGRITGRPKMNLNSLILHGISSITIFINIFALRISLSLSFLLSVSLILNLFSNLYKLPIPIFFYGTELICALSIMSFQSYLFLMATVSKRTNYPCIPSNFWKNFINKK